MPPGYDNYSYSYHINIHISTNRNSRNDKHYKPQMLHQENCCKVHLLVQFHLMRHIWWVAEIFRDSSGMGLLLWWVMKRGCVPLPINVWILLFTFLCVIAGNLTVYWQDVTVWRFFHHRYTNYNALLTGAMTEDTTPVTSNNVNKTTVMKKNHKQKYTSKSVMAKYALGKQFPYLSLCSHMLTVRAILYFWVAR